MNSKCRICEAKTLDGVCPKCPHMSKNYRARKDYCCGMFYGAVKNGGIHRHFDYCFQVEGKSRGIWAIMYCPFCGEKL